MDAETFGAIALCSGSVPPRVQYVTVLAIIEGGLVQPTVPEIAGKLF